MSAGLEVARREVWLGIEKQLRGAAYQVDQLHGSKVWEVQTLYTPMSAHLVGPVFLIQANWSAICRDIKGFAEEEFRLPFDACFFEMVIGGIRIVSHLRFDTFDNSIAIIVFFKTGDRWFPGSAFWLKDGKMLQPEFTFGSRELLEAITNQVRAASVLIEAEVLETVDVLPDHKLQKSRAKKGLPAQNPYLELRPRRRSEYTSSTEYQGVVRCHFRRGHWMRVGEGKVWRKWTIVGNPDLGFVDKTYVVGKAGAA